MKNLIIFLSLLTLTSCLSFKANKSSKESGNKITKQDRKCSKCLTKCNHHIKPDTLYIESGVVISTATIYMDSLRNERELYTEIESKMVLAQFQADEIGKECGAIVDSLGRLLHTIKPKTHILSSKETSTGTSYTNKGTSTTTTEISVDGKKISVASKHNDEVNTQTAVDPVKVKKACHECYVKGYKAGVAKEKEKTEKQRKKKVRNRRIAIFNGIAFLILLLVLLAIIFKDKIKSGKIKWLWVATKWILRFAGIPVP